MIDEFARRKPNFDEPNSVAVTFVDGQVFFVPKPWVEIRPAFKAGKATRTSRLLTCGPELDAILNSIQDADGDDAVAAVATLAAHLLLWHYDLADDELDTLLAYRIGDPTSIAWIGAVMDVATGSSGPKVERAGGG